MEQDLLQWVFGDNGTRKIQAASPISRVQLVRQASKEINLRLSALLPAHLGMQIYFDLDPTDTDGNRFVIHIGDKHGAETPLHFRGAGIRKMFTLIISVVLASLREDTVYILYDEPENSLHADAQHRLRLLLENLAINRNIQVIYTTHSPSMINALSHDGLRLLDRTIINSQATSVINNEPYRGNFSPVRSSLGLSPSDSLLYAPITIIFEGETEIRCLPTLLKKLFDNRVPGFEDLENVLPQCHFIDGEGDSLDYWCRLAKSQGSKPIIYVDGEKHKHVRQLQRAGRLEEVPIISLNDGQEFENLVPVTQYFEALKAILGQDIQATDFQKWVDTKSLAPQMMFSKRINLWLLETYDFELNKPLVMRKALDLTSLEQVDLNSVHQLMENVTNLLKS